jgi:hypothetical protein
MGTGIFSRHKYLKEIHGLKTYNETDQFLKDSDGGKLKLSGFWTLSIV